MSRGCLRNWTSRKAKGIQTTLDPKSLFIQGYYKVNGKGSLVGLNDETTLDCAGSFKIEGEANGENMETSTEPGKTC